VNGGIVLFQLQRGKVAGDNAGGGGLRLSSGSPFCCGKKPYDASGTCAREREERKDWREEMRASHCIGIEDIWRLYRGALASNLRSLAANLVQKKGETGEEEEAVYIGSASSNFKQVFKEN
jgi:hypothetical protein